MKKKVDLKKLALMGITGGVMLASQVSAHADMPIDPENAGAFGVQFAQDKDDVDDGCGGDFLARGYNNSNGNGMDNGKCGGSSGCGGNTNGNGMHNGNGMDNGKCGGSSGCGGKTNGNGNHNGNGNEMTERQLLPHLNSRTRALYDSMGPEGKALARKLAADSCSGQNDCKGMNSCKSDENDCADQGECKGHSNCNFKDKNMAVEVAAKKMAEKRQGMRRRSWR